MKLKKSDEKKEFELMKEKFKEKVFFFANKINVEPSSVSFRKMKRKWASCSKKGNISFNISILNKPEKFQEAVIIHELIHLIVPNHSKLFKSMFLSFMPDGEKILSSEKSL
jgi:predicted metal-dependent hydrolase